MVRNSNQHPKANTRNAPTPPPVPTNTSVSVDTANPYASGSAAAANDKGFEGVPKERSGRAFRFNQKGKYVQIGNQMRQQQQLDQLKQRIAESARKAGLDAEFETLEKNIKVPSNLQLTIPVLPNSSHRTARGPARGRMVGQPTASSRQLQRSRWGDRPIRSSWQLGHRSSNPAPDPDPSTWR